MASGGLRVGYEMKVSYNSATNASPTWVAINEIGDVSLPDLGLNLAEVNLRVSSWMMNLGGRMNVAMEFPLAFNVTESVHDALRIAFFARTIQQYAINEGLPTAGSHQGFKFYGIIESFPLTANLDDLTMWDTVRIAPAYFVESSAVVDPAWFTGSA